MSQTVTIDGVAYQLSDLNATAKKMIRNIEMAEARLRDLKQQVELATVARQVYLRTLSENLPKKAAAADPKLN